MNSYIVVFRGQPPHTFEGLSLAEAVKRAATIFPGYEMLAAWKADSWKYN